MYRGAVILGWPGRWARIKVGPSLPGKPMGRMGNSMSRCMHFSKLGALESCYCCLHNRHNPHDSPFALVRSRDASSKDSFCIFGVQT